jgi:hypothetical protein
MEVQIHYGLNMCRLKFVCRTILAVLLVPASLAWSACRTGDRGMPRPSGATATPASTAMPSRSIHIPDYVTDSPRLPGIPQPVTPLLYLRNDTPDTLTIRRIDDPSTPTLIMEPQAHFISSWGGEYFGGSSPLDHSREVLMQGDGVMLELSDSAGQPRGRILFRPSYLFGRQFEWLCLSAATEPPLVIESIADVRSTCSQAN